MYTFFGIGNFISITIFIFSKNPFNRTLFYALFFMTFSFSDREREEERGGAAMRSLEDREVSAMFHRDTLLARIVR